MSESQLLQQIIKHVYDNYTKMVFRVNTGSVIMRNGRRFSTGTPKGYSDLSGNLADGRAFYIEAKVKPNKPTAEQIAFIEKARANGALAGVAYSIADVDEILSRKENNNEKQAEYRGNSKSC